MPAYFQAERVALKSLTVFRPVAQIEPLQALAALFDALNAPDATLLAAREDYSNVLYRVREAGFSDLGALLLDQLKYDDSAFGRACAQGREDARFLEAARQDIAMLSAIAALSFPALKAAMAERWPEEREALRQQRAAASPTGDPNRPHGKGRAYVANRYGKDGEELVSESGEPVVIDDYEELSEEELPAVEESAVTEASAKPEAPAAEDVPSFAPEAEEAAADPAEDLLDDADASDSLFGASSDDTDDNT